MANNLSAEQRARVLTVILGVEFVMQTQERKLVFISKDLMEDFLKYLPYLCNVSEIVSNVPDIKKIKVKVGDSGMLEGVNYTVVDGKNKFYILRNEYDVIYNEVLDNK